MTSMEVFSKEYNNYVAGRLMHGLYDQLNICPLGTKVKNATAYYRPNLIDNYRTTILELVGINPSFLTKLKPLVDELIMFFSVEDNQTLRITPRPQRIVLEASKPKNLWQPITISDLYNNGHLSTKAQEHIVFGLDTHNLPVKFNFYDPTVASLLVCGETRSGKTNLIKFILWSLIRKENYNLMLIDVSPKFEADYKVFEGLIPVITDPDKASTFLRKTSLEMKKRDTKTIILIDELKSVVDNVKESTTYLGKIASMGAGLNYHLVLGTQYPQIKLLGDSTELKRNLSSRVCGKVDDSSSAVNALGVKDSGAECLQGFGDFLLKCNDGLPRFTAPMISDKHIDHLKQTIIVREPQQVIKVDKKVKLPKPKQMAYMIKYHNKSQNEITKKLGCDRNLVSKYMQYAKDVRKELNNV